METAFPQEGQILEILLTALSVIRLPRDGINKKSAVVVQSREKVGEVNVDNTIRDW